MQMQKQPEVSPANTSELKSQAVRAMRRAIESIAAYRQAKAPYAAFSPVPDDEEIRRWLEEEKLPWFLGAPGEVCEACNGSGRKGR